MKTVLISNFGGYDIGPLIRPFLGSIRFVRTEGLPVRGCILLAKEDLGEVAAELGEKRSLEVPFIDVTKLEPEQINSELWKLVPQKDITPNLPEMAMSFTKDIAKWIAAKCARPTQEQIDERLAICKTCEWWDTQAFNNTGRCRKCGCSTYAKIRLKTAKCPIERWPILDVEPEHKNV